VILLHAMEAHGVRGGIAPTHSYHICKTTDKLYLYLCENKFNLSVVLHGRETWYSALREEHKLQVSENKAGLHRQIIGPERIKYLGLYTNRIFVFVMHYC
jgi:hypothetical protein